LQKNDYISHPWCDVLLSGAGVEAERHLFSALLASPFGRGWRAARAVLLIFESNWSDADFI
jgi:hypothetical protein